MSAASAPSSIVQKTIGVLYLDGREKSTMLSDATRASLEAFATQAALAIDSARLYAESAEKARIDRDLRIAADIQRALLPEPIFETAYVDLAAAVDPVPDGRRRLLRLPRGRRARLRVRAGRRGRQGPAGGAARRGRAEQLRRARAGERQPRGRDGADQQGAAAPGHRSAVRDDVLRRDHGGRAV